MRQCRGHGVDERVIGVKPREAVGFQATSVDGKMMICACCTARFSDAGGEVEWLVDVMRVSVRGACPKNMLVRCRAEPLDGRAGWLAGTGIDGREEC